MKKFEQYINELHKATYLSAAEKLRKDLFKIPIKENKAPGETYFYLVDVQSVGNMNLRIIGKDWQFYRGSLNDVQEVLKYSFDDREEAEAWADEWAEGAGMDIEEIEINEYVLMSVIKKVDDLKKHVDIPIKENFNLYTLKTFMDFSGELYVKVKGRTNKQNRPKIYRVNDIDIVDTHKGTLSLGDGKSEFQIQHDDIAGTITGKELERDRIANEN